MRRTQILILALVAVLVVVVFFFLLFLPQRDQLAEVEELIADERAQHAVLEGDIERLRAVRQSAPDVEAELAAANSIVPNEAALPAALRQLQQAADEAQLTLTAITASRPVELDVGPEGLSSMDVNLQLSGGYFQVVDFLRRVEDPAITPRGLTWTALSVARDEYPELNVTLSGNLYARITGPLPPEPEAPPEVGGDDPDDAGGADDDLVDEEVAP